MNCAQCLSFTAFAKLDGCSMHLKQSFVWTLGFLQMLDLHHAFCSLFHDINMVIAV